MDVFTGSNPHLNQNDISHPFKRVMTELLTVRLTYYCTVWIMVVVKVTYLNKYQRNYYSVQINHSDHQVSCLILKMKCPICFNPIETESVTLCAHVFCTGKKKLVL